MGIYKGILTTEYDQFNKALKLIKKKEPSMPMQEKCNKAADMMLKAREEYLDQICKERGYNGVQRFLSDHQLKSEVHAMAKDLAQQVVRYYLIDDSLYDFFENTELSEKTVQYIINDLPDENCICYGIMGKTKSYCLYIRQDIDKQEHMVHIVTMLEDTNNSTFIPEMLSAETRNESKDFKIAMNFLLYLKAHPEMIIDGAPAQEKKIPKCRQLGVSPKVVSHTTTEHGFVKPHFRCGHYRHLDSDYYKNKKGQVIFIESTVVNGKAKTVLKRQGA